jgi:hypothetical protein
VSVIEPYADQLLFIMVILFIAGLLPTIYHQYKVKQSTIPLTGVGVSLVALVLGVLAYSSLGLWYATGMMVINGIGWAIVGLQRVMYGAEQGSVREFDGEEGLYVDADWMNGYLACQTPKERHAYLDETGAEHSCEAQERRIEREGGK